MCARSYAEDTVADGELAHTGPDPLDLTRELDAENPLLRPAEAGYEAADEVLGATKAGVGARDRRRPDLDEHLVVSGDGLLERLDSQDLRRPVPVVDDCSHEPLPSSVRTTFPVFWPVSTYFVASTTCSSG